MALAVTVEEGWLFEYARLVVVQGRRRVRVAAAKSPGFRPGAPGQAPGPNPVCEKRGFCA